MDNNAKKGLSDIMGGGYNPYQELRSQTKKLVEKWKPSGLLEGMDKESFDQHSMAILLENQARQLIDESSGTNPSGGAGDEEWSGVALPLVRKVFGEIASKDFVSVQPMNLPSGLVFYLNFTYGGGGRIGDGFTAGSKIHGVTDTKDTDASGGLYGAGRYAFTANSASLAKSEFDELLKIANQLSFNHRVIYTKEVEKPEYKVNTPQRCYFCKEELYTELKKLALNEEIPWIANGTNVDDLGDFRPGIKASKDFMIRSPLVESGINKKEVRAIAKEINISNWDKPAQACLSSRVAYGIKITDGILNRISIAEKHVKSLGIDQVRVRHHGNLARIEVPKEQISILMNEDNNRKITENLKKLGYVYVTVDLQGFRSGSMNDQLIKNTFS